MTAIVTVVTNSTPAGTLPHSRTENPQFISSVPSQPGDFSVLTSSPTMGAGVVLDATENAGLNNLSTWPGKIQLTTQSVAWNIGAFIILQ